MTQLNEIKINKFRGISNLVLTDLGKINLIVGDNNCGKTSILEAIQLLRNPIDINNLLRVARIRDTYMLFNRLPIFENFINMLNISDKSISINATYYEKQGLLEINEQIALKLTGAIKKIMIDYNELRNRNTRNLQNMIVTPEDAEIDEFAGQLIVERNGVTKKQNVHVDKFTNISGRVIHQNDMIKINYLSPIDHMISNTFNKIISNEKYKEICVKVLQLFDPDIVDLVLLRNDYPMKAMEYIKNRNLGLMPLSTYGDGIKKVLAIANAIAQSSNGILLIDEIDTAIHAKYYDDIFKFIVKASRQYNVQLFISTHSIEAIDGLLKTQVNDESEYQDIDDPIRVITLRKEQNVDKTYSRIMFGKDVYLNREKFNFEVRL